VTWVESANHVRANAKLLAAGIVPPPTLEVVVWADADDVSSWCRAAGPCDPATRVTELQVGDLLKWWRRWFLPDGRWSESISRRFELSSQHDLLKFLQELLDPATVDALRSGAGL
jgi:hypothetical protein